MSEWSKMMDEGVVCMEVDRMIEQSACSADLGCTCVYVSA